MHPNRYSLIAAAALGLTLAAPAAGQEAPAPETPATEAPAPQDPASEAPAPVTAPAADPSGTVATPAAPAGAPAGPTAPPQPEITVTEHGDWEVGCLADTPNCELQQVAVDGSGNPVVLVRLVRLPTGSEAQALAVFNTPLGTLLPTGLGFQVDEAQTAALPFEWCVQEGCVVRLGLLEPDVAALKRGRQVTLSVTSIADPQEPVELTLSLTGFTAGYDSLPVPPTPPAQPLTPPPAAAPQE